LIRAEEEAADLQGQAETERALRLEAEGRLNELTSKLDSKSLTTLVSFLGGSQAGVAGRIRSLDALMTADAAMDEESKRHQQYRQVARVCFDGLVSSLAGGDLAREGFIQDDIVDHVLRKRRREDRPMQLESRDARALVGLKRNIAQAWQHAKFLNDFMLSRQALSTLILEQRGIITHDDIMSLVSKRVLIQVGSPVLVLLNSRNSRARGVVQRISTDGGSTVYDIAPGVVGGRGRRSTTFLTGVQSDRVEHEQSLICLPGEVKAAAHHAAKFFPGARPEPTDRRGWTRMADMKKSIISEELRSKANVAIADGGAATAAKGIIWMLKVGTTVMLDRMNERLIRANQTPLCRDSLLTLIQGSNGYRQVRVRARACNHVQHTYSHARKHAHAITCT
jgi:hypothetical protein